MWYSFPRSIKRKGAELEEHQPDLLSDASWLAGIIGVVGWSHTLPTNRESKKV